MIVPKSSRKQGKLVIQFGFSVSVRLLETLVPFHATDRMLNDHPKRRDEPVFRFILLRQWSPPRSFLGDENIQVLFLNSDKAGVQPGRYLIRQMSEYFRLVSQLFIMPSPGLGRSKN